jgi:alkanesulfonate monooxygenase
MGLRLHWFVPSHGDGRDLVRVSRNNTSQSARAGQRPPDLTYLLQVALAADQAGFDSALVPTGLFCEDAWLVAAGLAAQVPRLKFLLALRPGLISPLLAAQMSATFQRMSGGRLLLNVVSGGDADEQRRYGDWLDHDGRYARSGEFVSVLRQAWGGDPFDFDGEHYRLQRAVLTHPPTVVPEVFLGGSSAAAQLAAVRHADVYLAWGEGPDQLQTTISQVRSMAGDLGKTMTCGSRYHVISRDTSEAAWNEATALIAHMSPARVEAAQERFRRSESEGQRRMSALHQGYIRDLEIYPNMWAGFGLLRPGPGVGLVGSHQEVADRIAELHSLGLEHLILSGQPHLEESYWFGEGVMPLLRHAGLIDAPAQARKAS